MAKVVLGAGRTVPAISWQIGPPRRPYASTPRPDGAVAGGPRRGGLLRNDPGRADAAGQQPSRFLRAARIAHGAKRSQLCRCIRATPRGVKRRQQTAALGVAGRPPMRGTRLVRRDAAIAARAPAARRAAAGTLYVYVQGPAQAEVRGDRDT